MFPKPAHPARGGRAGLLVLCLLLLSCENQLAPVLDPLAGKRITAFSFAEPPVTGSIDQEAGTISLVVPIGTDRSGLVASFATEGSAVRVDSILQHSGVSPNDFTQPLIYAVTAADGSRAYYAVSVEFEPDNGKSISSFSFPSAAGPVSIDAGAATIEAIVPYGTDLTRLVATFTSSGASTKVGSASQLSGVTANNFLAPVLYTVTAGDGSSAVWTVRVAWAPDSAKAITKFTFPSHKLNATVDEGAKTITAQLPYGSDPSRLVASFVRTGVSVKVGSVVQVNGKTANDFREPVEYVVYAADGSSASYMVSLSFGPNPAKEMTSFGFPALGVMGTVNETAQTLTATVPYGTDRDGLVAAFTTSGVAVTVGGTAQVSGASANNFNTPVAYTVTGADGLAKTYSAIVSIGPNWAKELLTFTAAGVGCDVDQAAKTVTGLLPYGTNLASLVAGFTASPGATVKTLPGPVLQTSGVTANNFTTPVTYMVTAEDGGSASYAVSLANRLNPAKAITAFSVDGASLDGPIDAVIDEGAKTISAFLPYEADLGQLVASFTTTGATVKVGAATQVSGTTSNDFSGGLSYRVTAADGSSEDYAVTLTKALVATPVITESGTFPRTVSISCATPGVTIYYSTTDETPMPGFSMVYGDPISYNCWGQRYRFRVVAYAAGEASYPSARTVSIVGPELSLAGTVTTIAGNGTQGWADGTGTAATFYSPSGVTSDGANLYIVDTNSSLIRKMEISSGIVTTLTGNLTQGATNGTLAAATFTIPTAITHDGDYFYVIDGGDRSLIRRIWVWANQVTTFAGSSTLGNPVEGGVGPDARFRYASSLATDGDYLYVADTGNNVIQRVGIHIGVGESTIFAGNPASNGHQDGAGATATFSSPLGLATDGTSLYVAEGSGYIRKINLATREVSTLAGQFSAFGGAGAVDGTGAAARFYQPNGLVLDGPNLYVADTGNNAIRKIVLATGEVSTLASLGFNNPQGICSDGTSLFVTNTGGNTIMKIE